MCFYASFGLLLSFVSIKNLATSLYNLLGERIYFSDAYQAQINAENIREGVYFVHLSFDSKTMIQKLRIVH
jgi:hypothetical protein